MTAQIDTATVHQFGTFTNVEVLTLDYTAAGTFKANDVSAATINMTVDGAAAAAVMNNIGTSDGQSWHDDLNGVTLDYTADATAVIQVEGSTAIDAGALTLTDAQTVTIKSAGGANTP